MSVDPEIAKKLLELHTSELVSAMWKELKKSPITMAQVAASTAVALMSLEAAKYDPVFADDPEQVEIAKSLGAMLFARFTKDLEAQVQEERAKKPNN